MNPEKVAERLSAWAVDEIYTKWEAFALNASIAAYDHAIKKAREESDVRLDLMGLYLEELVELHKTVIGEVAEEEEFRVYRPKKTTKKPVKKGDWL